MIKEKITAVVLAGGASKRMGRSKAQLPVGDKRMIEWVVKAVNCLFDETLVVTHHPQSFPMLENVRMVQDLIVAEKRSSLIGLYTGLYHATNDTIFVVPCDMPFLNRKLIEHMIRMLDGEDIRVPLIGQHFQPLHAFYRKSCLPFMRQSIDAENYKIIRFYDEVLVRTVDEATVRQYDPDLNCFMNVNNSQDYDQVQAVWKKLEHLWRCEWKECDTLGMRKEQGDDKHRSIGTSQRERKNSYI